MKALTIANRIAVSFFLFLMAFSVSSAYAEQYEGLKGVTSANTIFDFRDGKTGPALLHLKLVHQTYKDQAVRTVSDKPNFVVVFMGSSVVLLSSDREKFEGVEIEQLNEFDQTISAMAKDGIRLEVCLFAANLWGIKPETISPDIFHVENGWIASLGYQQKGYSLIPVY